MAYQSEAALEQQFIEQLNKQEYSTVDIPDYDALVENFKVQFEAFNAPKLDTPITDKEWERIFNLMLGKSVFQSAKILRDKFVLEREDGTKVYLSFFDQDHTKNIFQVTHQTTVVGKYVNRYDVTILVNGLPLIQVELKRRGIDIREAVNQVMRYKKHSYNGLYHFIQLFIVSNGVDTKYFANSDRDLMYSLAFFWTDFNNIRITNLKDFSISFLARDHIIKMLTRYTILNDTDKILMVMRPYQVYAVEALIRQATLTNRNAYIWHTTGAGKTFTLQLMALRMRRKGIQVFIVAPDKGHEFARACENIGGSFIQISPASSNCINVMEIRKTDKAASDILDGPMIQHSELASKIQDLHIFFSLLIPDMSHEEKQLLDEALIITYNRKGITHENQSLVDPEKPGGYKTMPILGDVYEVLMEKAETKRLANILNRMVHGSASSFNQQTNVDLSNKYVVLDISELSGDLLTVGMFVALDFVWSKAKEDRTVEKAIFIDEVWKLIGAASNEMAAEYVLEIFKIIRGYGGSGVCATQDLTDFFALKDGKYGRGIINNAKTKIILNMENNEAEQIKEVLHLSEAEMMSIVRFERGNGMISTNNNNLTVEFRASQLEKDLITTDRKDLKELRQRLERYGKGALGKRFD